MIYGKKQCSRCNQLKSYSEFYKLRDGLFPYCKRCEGERSKQWHRDNREQSQLNKRNWKIQNKYDLTAEQWTALFNAQGRKCGLCGSLEPKTKKGWQTDHDHGVGKVRGILCQPCNYAVGAYEKILQPMWGQVVEYLDGEPQSARQAQLQERRTLRG